MSNASFPLWNDAAVPVTDLDLDDVATFVQVVRAGGVSAAARVMQAPKSSVSRRVARLERRLGTRLLQRRPVTLTDAGQEFYGRVAAALAEVHDAADAAFDARDVPRGTVRLAAPPDVGAEVLPVLVAEFVAAHPLVRVEVELTADPPDPTGHDLALRVGRPVEHGVAAHRVQNMALRLYAAPGYLARAGAPTTVADLAGHDCVLYRPERGRSRWRLYRDGDPQGHEVVVGGRVTANDVGVVRRAAAAGAGIALLPRLVGEIAVAAGDLVPVLPNHRTDAAPLYLVHPAAPPSPRATPTSRAPHVPLAVRALRDHLLRRFPR